MPYFRYRFTTESAYLATQIIAFGSVYQMAETSVYIDEIKEQSEFADQVDPE